MLRLRQGGNRFRQSHVPFKSSICSGVTYKATIRSRGHTNSECIRQLRGARILGINSEGTESRPKPCLFVFPEHSKKRSAVAQACQGASSVDSTPSCLTTILLGE